MFYRRIPLLIVMCLVGSGCLIDVHIAPVLECEVGESFLADDGCNTCVCPASGLKSDANCTKINCNNLDAPCDGKICGSGCTNCAPGDEACLAAEVDKACNDQGECVGNSDDLCEKDLCKDVVCPEEPAYCDGDEAHYAMFSQCDPEDGMCMGEGLPPVDCSLEGYVCEGGVCVNPNPCVDDGECPGSEGSCNGDIAHAPADGYCDAVESGDCIFPALSPPQDCAADGQVCEGGFCVDPGDVCDPMDAVGEGPCDAEIGVVWDGMACYSLSGCSCVGADCGDLYETIQACDSAHSDCGDMYDPCINKECGDTCALCPPDDDDCEETGVVKACDPQGECVADTGDLCEDDLCAGVVCPNSTGYCEENIAYSGVFSYCDPDDGECIVAPGAPPQDCSELGQLCKDGQCVDDPKGCDPMQAAGVGGCEMVLGYTWNGKACVALSGCSCEGFDCDFLFDDPGKCADAYGDCTAPYDPCGDKMCGEACTLCDPNDKDCAETAVEKLCTAAGDCTIGQPFCGFGILPTSCEEAGPMPDDPFELVVATIEDDLLTLTASYGGGCAGHVFDACYGEVIPAGIDLMKLTISHDANNDPCLGIETKEFTVDLIPIQIYYKNVTGAPNGVIKLILDGLPEPLYYDF